MQGLTTGVIPHGIAIMRDVVLPRRLSTPIALMSATVGVCSALGLPLAAAAAAIAVALLLPKPQGSRPERRGRRAQAGGLAPQNAIGRSYSSSKVSPSRLGSMSTTTGT